jgi:hypothetical protein
MALVRFFWGERLGVAMADFFLLWLDDLGDPSEVWPGWSGCSGC